MVCLNISLKNLITNFIFYNKNVLFNKQYYENIINELS